jgi:hypothetical protein
MKQYEIAITHEALAKALGMSDTILNIQSFLTEVVIIAGAIRPVDDNERPQVLGDHVFHHTDSQGIVPYTYADLECVEGMQPVRLKKIVATQVQEWHQNMKDGT